ncbi:MAG: 2-oxoglutarate dehydrogenase complex dihydrolipoyllysine-residue succinyltransferase [Gammaproteobacteria bacterium]|nr:2-oxoglutarate dehydrogenase complex dihydrolipoyllysine-residue succinyltransferase [Gammaproteobacteria bacterium]
MSTEIKVPELPESITEATLVEWHKQPGEAVERDENLVDIETDKVVLEVPAPASGVLKEHKVEDGATVGAGDVIAIFDEGAEADSSDGEDGKESGEKGGAKPDQKEEEKGDEEEDEEETAEAGEEKREARKEPEAAEAKQGEARPLSPSVRRLIEEHDLDPESIAATGKAGRLTKADVLNFLESGAESKTKEQKPQPPASGKAAAKPASGAREERRVPMSRMRARIAERMLESQSSTAMLTSFNEVDLGAVKELRKRYKETFQEQHDVRLGFMSFFVKAAVRALQTYPVVNASVEDNDIVYHDYWDIGVAVSTDRGLMVPVLRDCDRLSFAEVERQIAEYAKSARDGKIALEDITGGTFTVTNGGVFGSLLSTPIINPPQSAILGMHKIQDRPMAVDGEVEIRPMMYIALTYDHRIIDGKQAVLFLVAIKEALEDPARLLIDI